MFLGPQIKNMSFRGEKDSIWHPKSKMADEFFESSDQKVRYSPKELLYRNWCLLPVCNQLSISCSIHLYYVHLSIQFTPHQFRKHFISLQSSLCLPYPKFPFRMSPVALPPCHTAPFSVILTSNITLISPEGVSSLTLSYFYILFRTFILAEATFRIFEINNGPPDLTVNFSLHQRCNNSPSHYQDFGFSQCTFSFLSCQCYECSIKYIRDCMIRKNTVTNSTYLTFIYSLRIFFHLRMIAF